MKRDYGDPMMRLVCILTLAPLAALAGGSNYGTAPGALPNLAGKVTEWPVPTPRFARDPAVAPDGSIFIAVMSGNKIARFDPRTKTFKEWDMPPGHRPHGVLVDKSGIAWSTGNGNGNSGNGRGNGGGDGAGNSGGNNAGGSGRGRGN